MSDQAYFDELITWATGELRGDEVLLAGLDAENTDFVRLNNSSVRQAGSVSQAQRITHPPGLEV